MISLPGMIAVLCGPVGGLPPPTGPPEVSVRYVAGAAGYTARSRDAPVSDVVRAIAGAAGCMVDLPQELGARRISMELSARPPERLLRALAFRLECRLETKIAVLPGAGRAIRGPRAFAAHPVSLRYERPTPLDAVLEALEVPVTADEALRRREVRVVAAREPLWRVLDHVASRLGAHWEVEVRLQPVVAGAGRAQAFYENLVALSTAERRDEIDAALEGTMSLTPEDRAAALERLSGDLDALGEMLRQVPSEHREPMQQEIGGLAAAFRQAITRVRTQTGDFRLHLLPAILRLQSRAARAP